MVYLKYKSRVLGKLQRVIDLNLMQLGKAPHFLLHMHYALQIFDFNKTRNAC